MFCTILGMAMVCHLGLCSFPAYAADARDITEILTSGEDGISSTTSRIADIGRPFASGPGDGVKGTINLKSDAAFGSSHHWREEIAGPFFGPYELPENILGVFGLEFFANTSQEVSAMHLPLASSSGMSKYIARENGDALGLSLKFSTTRPSPDGEALFQRIHLNVSWKYDNEIPQNDNQSHYVIVVGYDQRIAPNMMLIFDFMHDRDKEDAKSANIAGAGLRYQLTPLAVLSTGLGASIGDNARDFCGAISFHYSF